MNGSESRLQAANAGTLLGPINVTVTETETNRRLCGISKQADE